jgi:hypothetical protein
MTISKGAGFFGCILKLLFYKFLNYIVAYSEKQVKDISFLIPKKCGDIETERKA